MADTTPKFDPAWYLQAYPDVAGYLARGGLAGDGTPLDALSHYLKYGAAEGRHMSADDPGPAPTQSSQDKANMAAGGGTPRLDPSNPASWAAWADKAHAQTEGINRMPRMLGDTSQIGTDPMSVLAAFFPKGPQATAENDARRSAAEAAAGVPSNAQPGAGAAPAVSGNDAILMQLLQQQGIKNLGMGNVLAGGYNGQPFTASN